MKAADAVAAMDVETAMEAHSVNALMPKANPWPQKLSTWIQPTRAQKLAHASNAPNAHPALSVVNAASAATVATVRNAVKPLLAKPDLSAKTTAKPVAQKVRPKALKADVVNAAAVVAVAAAMSVVLVARVYPLM